MGGSQSAKVSFILGSLVTKGLLHTIPASRLLALLEQQDSAFISGADQTLFSVDESLQDIFNDDLVDEVAYRQFVQASEFIVRKLKLSIGEQAIVVNGRVSRLYIMLFGLLTSLVGCRTDCAGRFYCRRFRHTRSV